MIFLPVNESGQGRGRRWAALVVAVPQNSCDWSCYYMPSLQEFIFTSRFWGHLTIWAGKTTTIILQLPCSLYMSFLDGVPMKQTMKKKWLDAIELIQSNGTYYSKKVSRGTRVEQPWEHLSILMEYSFLYFVSPQFYKITLCIALAQVPHFLGVKGREMVSRIINRKSELGRSWQFCPVLDTSTVLLAFWIIPILCLI